MVYRIINVNDAIALERSYGNEPSALSIRSYLEVKRENFIKT